MEEYQSYADEAAVKIRKRIENMDEKATAEEWQNQILAIGKEYTCSARVFLLSYLSEHGESNLEDTRTYTISFGGREYKFQKVTAQYAFNLPDEERNLYIRLLTEIAADNHGDSLNNWRPLMWKAMLRNKKTELLTRQEGFQIAHGLQFSLKQAEEFLVRVLDNDGFCYTRSEDIIEAFCFLHKPANNWYTAQELKKRYHQQTDHISKSEAACKPNEFTRSVAVSLPERILEWEKTGGENTMECFMDWLISQAAFLDVPSRSAYEIYRRLAAYAYELTVKITSDTVDSQYDFIYEIRKRCFDENYVLEEADEYRVTSVLLRYARDEFDNQRKRKPEEVWRYLTADARGGLTAVAIGDRIPGLLTGKTEVTKADLLFLLWYVCNLFYSVELDYFVLYDRIVDFWELAEELLDKALLPQFYVPHILERSFLIALLTETKLDASPFEIYEGMCEFVLPKKERPGGRKSEEEKQRKSRKTKKSRSKLEHDTENLYAKGMLSFEGIEADMKEHFLEHAQEMGQYCFTNRGIFYYPDPEVKNPDLPAAISYRNAATGTRFDMSRKDYKEDAVMEERFQFLYGLALYLTDNAAAEFYQCDFRVNYRKKATLTVIRWKEEKRK